MKLVVKNEKDMDIAIQSFSALINSNINNGWEFYSME